MRQEMTCSIIYFWDEKWTQMKFCHVFYPYIYNGQASLLRSHAGGLSVVATTECMLYAASEVSVILRQAVWPSTHSHLSEPPLSTTYFCQNPASSLPPPPAPVPSLTLQVP